jgi:alkylation response protein AidB-like acyl-CoA dehydrogenase
MVYGFTKEEAVYRDLARDYAQKRLANVNYDDPGEVDKIAHEFSDMGLLGMTLPEEYGGLGATNVQFCSVIEELSTVDHNFNHLITKSCMDGRAIIIFGSPEIKEKYLPKLISGDLRPATALTEANVGSDASGVETKAELRDDGKWHINGTKMFCSQINGKADVFLLVTQTNKELRHKGIATFLADRNFPGFQDAILGDICGEGPYMKASELILDDYIIPPENMLGQVGQGFQVVSCALDVGRLTIAASAVGMCQHAINESIKYIKERKQFGKEIVHFQLVQAKLADMITQTEAARSLLYRAASLVDQADGTGDRIECSYAKYFCSEVAQKVTYDAIQLHGGYGLSNEYPLVKLWEGVRQMTIIDGTSDIQRLMIGRNATGVNALRG